MDTFELVSAVV